MVDYAVRAVESAGRAVLHRHSILLRPFVDAGPLVSAFAALKGDPEPAMLLRIGHGEEEGSDYWRSDVLQYCNVARRGVYPRVLRVS